MLSSASYKANLFSKNCSKNYNLESSGISLPAFASTTNQKLKSHNKPWIIKDLWSWLHYHGPVSLLSVVSKVFEKLVNNRFVEHLAKCGLFSDFQYCFKSIYQLQIFWQLHLIELLGLLSCLGLLKLQHLIYPKLLTGVWHAGVFYKLRSDILNFRSDIWSYFVFSE